MKNKKMKKVKKASRYQRSIPFKENVNIPELFKVFFKNKIAKKLTFSGYKIPQKKDIACKIAYNLITAGAVGKLVARQRNYNKVSTIEMSVWNEFIKSRLAIFYKGGQWDEGTTSRYRATRKLLQMKKLWHKELVWEENEIKEFNFTKIHTGKKNEKKEWEIQEYIKQHFKSQHQNILNKLNEHELFLRQINKMNSEHIFLSPIPDRKIKSKMEFDPRLTQIHSGGLWHIPRFYTVGIAGAQHMPKEQRAIMTIDGEPCVELDFISCQPRILYQLFQKNDKGDLYKPERFFKNYNELKPSIKKELRKIVKTVFVTAVNSKSRAQAKGSLFNFAKKSTLMKKCRKYITYSWKNNIIAETLLKKLEKAHDEIGVCFYREYGKKLMFLESQIMFYILKRFLERGKPFLPFLAIHDCLVVRKRDMEFAKQVMNDCWKLILSKVAEIKVKYPKTKRIKLIRKKKKRIKIRKRKRKFKIRIRKKKTRRIKIRIKK